MYNASYGPRSAGTSRRCIQFSTCYTIIFETYYDIDTHHSANIPQEVTTRMPDVFSFSRER